MESGCPGLSPRHGERKGPKRERSRKAALSARPVAGVSFGREARKKERRRGCGRRSEEGAEWRSSAEAAERRRGVPAP